MERRVDPVLGLGSPVMSPPYLTNHFEDRNSH